MLDLQHLPSAFRGDVQIFGPNATLSGNGWATWNKPRGCTMAYMMGIGPAGKGGNGAVGGNSAAAGGGGGGSGGQTSLLIPLIFLPDVLFISVGYGSTAAPSRVCVAPDVIANNCLLIANRGEDGGNASGVTAGTAGVAAAIATIATMPLAGLGTYTLLAGQAGIVGGTTVAGAALTLPLTGLTLTGGTGGGGVPAAANAGTAGGAFTVAGVFPPQPGGANQTTSTLPGNDGSNGLICAFNGLEFSYGGTGGGSSHGSATGAGLFGGKGGAGGPGSGGGGGGGCLTGGTAGTGGKGGDGQVVIVCW